MGRVQGHGLSLIGSGHLAAITGTARIGFAVPEDEKMTYRGHIKNGVVVLDENAALPEGTAVQVQPLPSPPRKTLAERFQNVIGRATELPEDMAAHHDHYIHGAPKQ